MTKKTTIVAVILGIVMIVGGGGVALAFAAPAVASALPGVSALWHGLPGFGPRGGRGAAGTVASVTSAGFTVTEPGFNGGASRTVTVTVTSQTKIYFEPANTTGSQSDITVGAKVGVSGSTDSSGVLQAQTVTIEPAGDTADGRVTAVNGATITVTSGMGMARGWRPFGRPGGSTTTPVTTTVQISTDTNTKFYESGGKAAALTDVKVGSFVQAWGQKQADGSLQASQVLIRLAGKVPAAPGPRPTPPAKGPSIPMPFFMGRGGVAGTVASVTSNGFTVTVPGANGAAGKTITVTVTSQTKVFVFPGNTAGSMSDVTVGTQVRVLGRPDSSGAVQAQTLTIEPAGTMAGGRVSSVDGNTITVTMGMGMGWRQPGQPRGNGNGNNAGNATTLKIVTDGNTKFVQPGGKAASLTDVKVGGFVQAWGQKQADGSLTATEVVVGGVFPGGPRPRQPANPQGGHTI